MYKRTSKQSPNKKTYEGGTENVYYDECFRGKKESYVEEDDIVMICKNVKCFWNEEQNNQFSLPREDRNWINGLEFQLGRFKIDIK